MSTYRLGYVLISSLQLTQRTLAGLADSVQSHFDFDMFFVHSLRVRVPTVNRD